MGAGDQRPAPDRGSRRDLSLHVLQSRRGERACLAGHRAGADPGPRCDDPDMRLFVALTPPAAVVEELCRATGALRAQLPALRWARPEQWHLTLTFLGEVDDRSRTDLAERLARVAARAAPLTLSVGAAGRFGDRVLWMRVHGEIDGLRQLAASVRFAARRARLSVEDRPYRPHLTVARGRG